MSTADARFEMQKKELGLEFETEFKAGANYEVAVVHGTDVYISGQVPRVQGKIMVLGRVGQSVTLEQARHAAQICVLRALSVLRQSVGSLNRVEKVVRLTVYVQSAADFTQQSEVADGASDILYAIFPSSGGHTRTSVGVFQLPKDAAVELDMIAAIAVD